MHLNPVAPDLPRDIGHVRVMRQIDSDLERDRGPEAKRGAVLSFGDE